MIRPGQFFRLFYINRILLRHGLDEIILATHLFRPLRFLLYFAPWYWLRGKLPPRVLTFGARYDKMMEAFGGRGWYIEDPKDLRGALDAAMAFPGPALVNVLLHPEAGRKPQQFGWHTA